MGEKTKTYPLKIQTTNDGNPRLFSLGCQDPIEFVKQAEAYVETHPDAQRGVLSLEDVKYSLADLTTADGPGFYPVTEIDPKPWWVGLRRLDIHPQLRRLWTDDRTDSGGES
jgi:hypothetical protein